MKELAGLLFIFGIPLLCIFLLRHIRKSNRNYEFLGWSLFIIGSFMSLIVVQSSGHLATASCDFKSIFCGFRPHIATENRIYQA